MSQFVFGLTGIRGAGKDTVAQILCDLYGFHRLAFADKLYKEVAGAFAVSPEFLGNRETKESPLLELGLRNCADPEFQRVATACGLGQEANSPRAVLQVWGTEYRRKQDDRYWLKAVESEIARNPNVRFVVTDCRYKNEAATLFLLGGQMLRVVRPAIIDAWASDARSAHPSERDLLDIPVNHTFINEEDDIGGLEDQVIRFMRGQINNRRYQPVAA